MLCEQIQIHDSAIHMNILIEIHCIWALIVCLNDFELFSILNLKVARNRKIPEDLMETQVLYMREQ